MNSHSNLSLNPTLNRLKSESVKRLIRLAITGTMGSGKSRARAILARHGVRTCDADELWRALTQRDQLGYRRIVAAFGRSVLTASGRLSRRRLRALIAVRPPARKRLETIAHPLIRSAYRRWRSEIECSRPPRVWATAIEATFILRSPMRTELDGILLVESSAESQRKRLQKRSIPQDVLCALLTAQREYYRASIRDRRVIRIENSGSLAALKVKLLQALNRLRM